jgi:hypothetical protein
MILNTLSPIYVTLHWYVSVWAIPVASWSEVQALIAHTLDRKFESRLRHGCLTLSFYVMLSCAGRGLAMSWSLIQGILSYVEIDWGTKKKNQQQQKEAKVRNWTTESNEEEEAVLVPKSKWCNNTYFLNSCKNLDKHWHLYCCENLKSHITL